MKSYNLIVIGGDAAGMSAASQARRIASDMSIAVFEKGNFVSYAACGMPYLIADDIDSQDRLLIIDKEKFITKRKIEIMTESEVTAVNTEKKIISVESKNRTETVEYHYETLIIATGARSSAPPIPGADENERVFYLRNLNDGIRIKNFLDKNSPKKGIIIGGGFIGLEMAEAYRKRGIETTILEKMDSVAMTMSPEIREKISETLITNKVTIETGVDIKEIIPSGEGVSVRTSAGEHKADFLTISVGVKPNTEFLAGSGIALNERGAILVNERSETNIPGVYAAGDCATVKHLLTGKDVYMPLGSTANKQGRIAGLRSAGEPDIFKGIVGSQFVKVFDLEIGKTGFNAHDAEAEGITSRTVSTAWNSRAGYYPGAQKLLLTLTVNVETGTVIGGEVAGPDKAAIRTNTIAAAIASRMSVEVLAYLDLGYAPPFSPVWDPVNAVAQKYLRSV